MHVWNCNHNFRLFLYSLFPESLPQHSILIVQPFVGPWPLFQFLDLYTVCRTSWTGDQPVARSLPTHRTTQTENKRTQTSMPLVGSEPTIPVFEREKTIHASDRAATVSGAFAQHTFHNYLIFLVVVSSESSLYFTCYSLVFNDNNVSPQFLQ
jgi:hypothetical protein